MIARVNQALTTRLLLLFLFVALPLLLAGRQEKRTVEDVQTDFDKLANTGGEWKSLFNGTTFDGWSRTLQGGHEDRLDDVFRVADDGSILITGEMLGALTLDGVHGDYHLKFETKFGNKRWPPREDATPNGGLLYHGHGPADAVAGVWHRSIEHQGQQGDRGDAHFLAGPNATVAVSGQPQTWDPAGEQKLAGGRVLKRGDFETDGWNTLELIVRGDEAWHVVNGRVVMHLTKLVDQGGKPLTKGIIQFQSELAEIHYRNLEMRKLPGTNSGTNAGEN